MLVMMVPIPSHLFHWDQLVRQVQHLEVKCDREIQLPSRKAFSCLMSMETPLHVNARVKTQQSILKYSKCVRFEIVRVWALRQRSCNLELCALTSSFLF